ncbi:hypothetical protein HGRIS_005718 [Hohenbuehelia grisea]
MASTPWIWTNEGAPLGEHPNGRRGFRKTFKTPRGKCARSATILIGADNLYQLYVNGVSQGIATGWQTAGVHYAALDSKINTFAIAGTNWGGPASVGATIRIQYTDGSSDIFKTDDTWRRSDEDPPKDWQQPNFDDSAWAFAQIEGMNGVAPWGRTASPPVLSMDESHWIWSHDVDGNNNAPIGTRFFRKVFKTPSGNNGKRAISATVIITTDNSYTLWANGYQVGSGDNWQVTQAYHIPILHPVSNTFAVKAFNGGGPAGVVATIHITYDDGTNDILPSDSTWKVCGQQDATDFQTVSYDDSAWKPAFDVGLWGTKPWWGKQALPLA